MKSPAGPQPLDRSAPRDREAHVGRSGWLESGWLGKLDALLPLRLWWLMPVGYGVQFFAQWYVRTNEEMRWLKATLLIAALCIALLPAWANRQRWGARIIGLGIAMNLLAMLANGGLMPITPEARLAAGRQAAAPVNEFGRMVPRTKNVLLPADQANLYPLTDHIVLGTPVNKVISPGDVLLGAGIVILIGELAAGARNDRRRTAAALNEA